MVNRLALLMASVLTGFLLVLVGGAIFVVVSTQGQPLANSNPMDSQIAMMTPVESIAQVAPVESNLQTSTSQAPTKILSADQAKRIAQNLSREIQVTRTDLVDAQGKPVYQVTTNRGIVYVDATSGNVLNSERSNSTQTARREKENEKHEEEDND
jgi:hypothetical protein